MGKLETKLAFFVFLLLLIHGSVLGLSDDEAYYWVLAQKPSLGYAFHPPAVAWMIAFFQGLLGWIFGTHSTGLVRLPAALNSALILGLSLRWLSELGFDRRKLLRAGTVLLSFFGFFSLSWMMVPDSPLFLGWTLLFVCTWSICFGKPTRSHYLILTASSVLILLSKYSGVLNLASAYFAIGMWAKGAKRAKGWVSLTLGAGIAAVPILIWNAQHDWGSLLYQIHDRHGAGEISWHRYLRFWVAELVLAGPILVGFTWVWIAKTLIFRKKAIPQEKGSEKLGAFLTAWIVPPALVFCLQPLFSDFKLHWAFIVWWPAALALAWTSQTDRSWKWIKLQSIYGGAMGALVLISCHLPLGSWIPVNLMKATLDPRWDVTNDLYGWAKLRKWAKEDFANGDSKIPAVGSRYQTASQAAFNLNGIVETTLLPRDLKAKDEWPDLGIADWEGPSWPKLKKSILFVADNRYDAPPAFPQAKCSKLIRLEEERFGHLAKWIDLWRCDP